MQKFIPREKLGRKARKALDAQGRGMWGISPISRRVQSKKIYTRCNGRLFFLTVNF